MSAVVWALAQLEAQGCEDALRDIIDEAEARIDEFSTQDLSRLAYGLSQLGFKDCRDFLSALSVELDSNVKNFRIEGFVQALEGLVGSQYHPGEITIRRLSRVSVDKIHEFTPRDLATLLECIAQLCAANECSQLIVATSRRVKDFRDQVNSVHLVRMAWALAIMNKLDNDMLDQCLLAASYLPAEGCHRLRVDVGRCLLHMRVRKAAEHTPRVVPGSPAAECYRCWRKYEVERAVPTAVLEAFGVLEEDNFECNPHHIVAGGLFVAHTVSGRSGRRFALEVDSQSLCFQNRPQQLLGEVVWRRQMLEALGWSPLCIEEEKWDIMDTDQRWEYLNTLMRVGDKFSKSGW
ncbi:unnamed protein product [Ostreobium quekettii]|uniref:RAP domain-containing protein n=1 Tax=Ostreobium quekettii TaxID=121088 RepID=A0A8S1IM91_9CHLO|nr:unnamed protein product [Ostreobium quekettii]|eukprot:evm.model.scf_26.13 EVM.evm.TU.scf_26.13   scf_26:97080-98614(+)